MRSQRGVTHLFPQSHAAVVYYFVTAIELLRYDDRPGSCHK